MKTKIFIVTVLFCFFGSTLKLYGQLTKQQEEQIKHEVKPALDSVIARWARMDIEGCLEYYSPELEVVDGTVRHGIEEYKSLWLDYNKSLVSVKVITIREDFIVLSKDLVISTWAGKDEDLMKSGDKLLFDPMDYTLVFKNFGGQWKVIYSHASGNPVLQKAEKK